MGKFKTLLSSVKKSVEEIQKETDQLYADLVPALNSLTNQGLRFNGGYETLYFYLQGKIKKDGESYDQHLDKSIKDFLDKNVALFVKEIEDTRKEAIKQRLAYDKTRAELLAAVKKVEPLKVQVAELQKSLAKKKKALIQTKAYKSKVAGYEKALDELVEFVQQRHELLKKGAVQIVSLKYFENTKLSASTTLKEIGDAAGPHVDAELRAAETNAQDTLKKFRARNPKAMLALVKNWIEEADEMEASAEQS
jgi:hypothetical protein